MRALDDLVRSGMVRYLGASSMWAYQFAMLQHVAEKNNWARFISMQNHYNLLYREEEREMMKYCQATGVGLIPVSPDITIQLPDMGHFYDVSDQYCSGLPSRTAD